MRLPVNWRCILILAAWALAWSSSSAAEPYTPVDGAEVLTRVPLSSTAKRPELERLRSIVRAEPNNLQAAVRLAGEYLTAARQQADPRYYGYIQTALAPWWNQAQPPAEALLIRAATRAARHDFDAALDDLAQVLRVQPRSSQAWLSRSVMLSVIGRYEEAMSSCLPLRMLAGHLLSDTCISNTASLRGRAAASAALLDSALKSSQSDEPDTRAWALGILADINNRIGRYSEAEENYLEALEADIPDAQLLAAYADFLIEQDRPGDVIDLLNNEGLPDALLLRLALAERVLNSPALSAHVAELGKRFAAADRRGEDAHLRERARYTLQLLDQPTSALELALRNWSKQREPADARLVLEAALAAGMADAAQPVLRWRTQTGIEDLHLTRLADGLENL